MENLAPPNQTLGREQKYCHACGAIIDARAALCTKCGVLQSGTSGQTGARNKLVAALLAIFLGWLGIHKFYLGKPVQAIFYILFCWTFIPSIIAFVEGIIYLTTSDEAFQMKYG